MELRYVIETLLFFTQKPLSVKEIKDILKQATRFNESSDEEDDDSDDSAEETGSDPDTRDDVEKDDDAGADVIDFPTEESEASKNEEDADLTSSEQPSTESLSEKEDDQDQEGEGGHQWKVPHFYRTSDEEMVEILESIASEYTTKKAGFRLVCVAGSWQFVSCSEFAPWIQVLLGRKVRPPRLSQPALETLSIIAYRQPLTRAEIEQIRGVSVDGVMSKLLERELVESVGRAEVVGRPVLYGTTELFLEYFGLSSLDDLPGGDELRKLRVKGQSDESDQSDQSDESDESDQSDLSDLSDQSDQSDLSDLSDQSDQSDLSDLSDESDLSDDDDDDDWITIDDDDEDDEDEETSDKND